MCDRPRRACARAGPPLRGSRVAAPGLRFFFVFWRPVGMKKWEILGHYANATGLTENACSHFHSTVHAALSHFRDFGQPCTSTWPDRTRH